MTGLTMPVFDTAKFEQLAAERKSAPREPRTIDTLLEAHSTIVDLVTAGFTYREIWKLMREAGLEATYPTFARAMVEFLELAKMPSRKELKRKLKQDRLSRRLPAVPDSVTIEDGVRTAPGGSLAARRARLGASPQEMERDLLKTKIPQRRI
jgi:SOS response regulatory protein OraA/RecX